MKFNSLYSLISEMPISNFSKLGSEDSWKTRKTYDKKTFEDLKNKSFETKVRRAFRKTVDDISFYFINDKHLLDDNIGVDFSETGKVDANSKFWDYSKIKYEDIQNDNEISIVFIGNYGDQLVSMTPWILAHRIGHVFNASARHDRAFEIIFKELEEQLVLALNIVFEDYGIKRTLKRVTDFESEKYTIAVMEKIGKFKSAKNKKIARPYEFIYELFAQYLITGEVEFESPPYSPIVIKHNEVNDWYGEIERYKYKYSEDSDLDGWARGIQYYFDSLTSNAIGEVFIM